MDPLIHPPLQRKMTRPRLSLGVIGLLLSAAPSAFAQTGVRLTLLDGTEITGQWAPCDRPDRIAVGTSSIPETFAVNDLLSVQFEKRTPKILEGDWAVTVRGNGGSVFPANSCW